MPTRDTEQGAVAILMAIMMAALAGFGALGFDLAHARYARLELQNATDAAAHAALLRLRATANRSLAKEAAKSIAAQHRVAGKPLLLSDDDIELGGWNFTTHTFTPGVSPANAVQVSGWRSDTKGLNGGVGTSFARIFGLSAMNVAHEGTAAFRMRTIVIAQDVTGSFAEDVDEAARADVALLDELHSFRLPSDRIGMQLFTGDSRTWTALTSVKTGYAAIRSQWSGDGRPSSDGGKGSGITVCHKLDINPHAAAPFNHRWVPACSSGGDGTNPGAALRGAREQLLASTQPYESRVVVLVTDGRPACCTTTGGVTTCDENNGCAMDRAAYGVEMADRAAADGIHIFTVSFGADPEQAHYVASLARGAGVSYDTPDPTELTAILTEIAGRVPVAIVR